LVPGSVPVVFDAEDVDSEKWRSYSQSKAWPLSWIYKREADKLLAFEREMAASTDVSLFVSPEEAELFKRLAPESASKIHHRTQGVDHEYFDPKLSFKNPYEKRQKTLVFTGAMDYLPNIQAVKWFCEHALAGIRQQQPDALFCIVGMKPTDEVKRLGNLPGVRVTGGVPDVRPFLAHAVAACLPLQIARGIQNKVLEAMSMSLPVLATQDAFVGIEKYPGLLSRVANDSDSMIAMAVDILSGPRQYDEAARRCIMEKYDWSNNLKRVEEFLSTKKEESGRKRNLNVN